MPAMRRTIAAVLTLLAVAAACEARRLVDAGGAHALDHPAATPAPAPAPPSPPANATDAGPRHHRAGRSSPTNATASPSFDYFLFVRQWDPSICDAMQCGPRKPSADAFTIHGLWPERADGSWPQYCGRPDSWTPADLAPLLPRLKAAWPSFGPATPDPDPAFWAHEWLRHGTCAGLGGGPRTFFEAVLGLDAALPLGPAFAAAGITPGGGVNASFAVADLSSAVARVTGSLPAIRCGPPRSRARGELAEVWVCLDKATLDVMDCPANVRRGGACPGGRVRLPSLLRQSANSSSERGGVVGAA